MQSEFVSILLFIMYCYEVVVRQTIVAGGAKDIESAIVNLTDDILLRLVHAPQVATTVQTTFFFICIIRKYENRSIFVCMNC